MNCEWLHPFLGAVNFFIFIKISLEMATVKRIPKPRGIGIAATMLLAALLIAAAFVPAMSAVEDAADGNGTRDTVYLGSLYTDGGNEIAIATCVGHVTVPAGGNTFCASWQNINDANNDGRGATFRLTVWDAAGRDHTVTKRVDRAGSGTISVSFNSHGIGDGEYLLHCKTYAWFIVNFENKASDLCHDDLDYFGDGNSEQ